MTRTEYVAILLLCMFTIAPVVGTEPITKPVLWARIGIPCQVFVPDPRPHAEQEFLVYLWMVNDGDNPVIPRLSDSKLIVNGEELKDSDFILGNGRRPASWMKLEAHAATSLGLNLADHFRKPGTYRISWKGEGFESPEVSFRVLSPELSNAPYDWHREQVKEKKRNAAILRQLNVIRFPEVNFDNKTLAELLQFLTEESRKFDPNNVGVKFEMTEPKFYADRKPGKVWHNIALVTVLRNLTQLSGLTYTIQEDKVVIHR